MDTHGYLGIDVSRDRLDIHIRPLDTSAAIANDKTGFAELAAGALRTLMTRGPDSQQIRFCPPHALMKILSKPGTMAAIAA